MVRERRPGTGRDRAAGRNLRQTVDGDVGFRDPAGNWFYVLDQSREG
jgi:hypothetical protein